MLRTDWASWCCHQARFCTLTFLPTWDELHVFVLFLIFSVVCASVFYFPSCFVSVFFSLTFLFKVPWKAPVTAGDQRATTKAPALCCAAVIFTPLNTKNNKVPGILRATLDEHTVTLHNRLKGISGSGPPSLVSAFRPGFWYEHDTISELMSCYKNHKISTGIKRCSLLTVI